MKTKPQPYAATIGIVGSETRAVMVPTDNGQWYHSIEVDHILEVVQREALPPPRKCPRQVELAQAMNRLRNMSSETPIEIRHLIDSPLDFQYEVTAKGQTATGPTLHYAIEKCFIQIRKNQTEKQS